MSDQRQLLDAIASIYSAPGSVENWSRAIQRITELVGGAASAYLMVNGETRENELAAVYGFSAADIAAYKGPNGAAKDIRFQYMHNLEPGKVYREFEFVPDRTAWDACEWIQYQLKYLNVYWGMAAKICTYGVWLDFISINRLHSLGPHSDNEKADLQALIPHLSRAAELHRMLTSLEHRYKAVLGVLDKLKVGLILLDGKGRVAVANMAAREISERTGCLEIGKDASLRVRRPTQEGLLRKLIFETGLTSNANGKSDGGSLLLPNKSQSGSLLVEVMPIRGDGFPDGDNIHGTALFLIDPDAADWVSLSAISKIFNLTDSEQAVASALINGASVKEIAEQRSVSESTIRSQLQSIFAKTNTESQVGLMRLAMRSAPPIM